MIQEINAEFDNTFQAEEPRNDDSVLCYQGAQILARQTVDALQYPMAADFSSESLTRLFSVGGQAYFLARTAPEHPPLGFDWLPIRALRAAHPQTLAFAGITGRHLDYWYRTSRFCGRCGAENRPSKTERAMVCSKCGLTVYPVIAPAVIIGVCAGDRIVVSRYANRPYQGMALIAGYCEIGETPEDTVRREVMEEIGLRVRNIRYYKSQPWGFDHNLLLGFFCEAEPDAVIRPDHRELAEARWIRREEIGDLPDSASLTFDMLAAVRYKKDKGGASA